MKSSAQSFKVPRFKYVLKTIQSLGELEDKGSCSNRSADSSKAENPNQFRISLQSGIIVPVSNFRREEHQSNQDRHNPADYLSIQSKNYGTMKKRDCASLEKYQNNQVAPSAQPNPQKMHKLDTQLLQTIEEFLDPNRTLSAGVDPECKKPYATRSV